MTERGSDTRAANIALEHGFANVNGTRVHYATGGDGPPVLLLAGWPQTMHAWRKVVPLLLAAGRSVVLADLRGQGASDKPGAGYDLDTLATDIHHLLGELGLAEEGVDVLSHDVGSWVAFALASAHPASVRSLILSEMTLQRPDVARPLPGAEANVASWHFAFNRLPELPEALVQGRERIFIDWLLDHKSTDPAAIDEHARRAYAAAFSAPGAARAGFEYYRALLSPAGLQRTEERARQPLAMPLLAIGATHGVGDRLADSLREANPNLSAVTLDVGHYVPEEAPNDLARAALYFWRGSVA